MPDWLAKHGGIVSSLHVDLGSSDKWQAQLRLPLQLLHKLQRLHLSFNGSNECGTQSSSSGNSNSSWGPLAGSLTALVLQHCTLRTLCGGLAAVTALTGLRRLRLEGAALQMQSGQQLTARSRFSRVSCSR